MRDRAPLRRSIACLTLSGFLASPLAARAAEESLFSAFNLFSVEQDIEIGRESAAEAEPKLTLLGDPSVDAYLNRIVAALAVQAPGANYPYGIKAVNDPAINAFSLPGGPMYANRGLLEAARNEAELAGVIAHEMAHVALRHGTNQASKATLASTGLGILGGVLGDSNGDTAQMLAAAGGLGLNAAFLKFGRDAEFEADRVGAEMMAPAGYDPNAMADFFATLRAEGQRNPSALETFFSDHPPSAEREARIRAFARTAPRAPARTVGGFSAMVAGLANVPAGSSRAISRREAPRAANVASSPPANVPVAAASTRFETFEHRSGLFAIEYPANWTPRASTTGYATTIAPQGGIVETAKGQYALVYGVIVNHYAPFEAVKNRHGERKRNSLASATDDLVSQILRSNPYLSAQKGAAVSSQAGGIRARSATLAGRSPVTKQGERVVVYTRALPDDHIVYGLLVSPESDYAAARPIFERMMKSLDVHSHARSRLPAGIELSDAGHLLGLILLAGPLSD